VSHGALLAAGVAVEHHEQVILAEVIRRARFFWRPEANHSLFGRRGGGGGGAGRPLAGLAAEVRGQRPGGVLRHHGGQLLRLGVQRVAGKHLAQVRDAGGAQHVFMQERGVVLVVVGERRGSAVRVERQVRLSVRHQTTEGLERVEEAVSPREEVHVGVMGVGVMVVVVVGERGWVEASSGTALHHPGLEAALVLQHHRDAGHGHRHDSTGREATVHRQTRTLQG